MLVNVLEKLKEIGNKIKDIAYRLDLIADYVVERGTDDTWTYRKWAGGDAECWGVFDLTTAAIGTEGSSYWSPYKVNLPDSLFVETPEVNVNVHGNWISGATLNKNTNSARVGFYLWSATSVARTNFDVDIKAVGKWK